MTRKKLSRKAKESLAKMALIVNLDEELMKMGGIQRLRELFSQFPPAYIVDYEGKVSHQIIKTKGTNLRVTIYQPKGTQKKPLIIYYHGGGYCLGSPEEKDLFCKLISKRLKAVVVVPNYRKAPEHRYPYAIEDSYETLCWAEKHCHKLGADKQTIVLAGDSAGGGISAAVSIKSRDNNGPKISLQVLIYPWLDLLCSLPSIKKYSGYLMTEFFLKYCANTYLGGQEHHVKHPYVSPFHCQDLTNLPPAIVITAGYDPLVDEGTLYAKNLLQAGIPVIHRHFASQIHGFIGMFKEEGVKIVNLMLNTLEIIKQKRRKVKNPYFTKLFIENLKKTSRGSSMTHSVLEPKHGEP